MKYIYSLMAIAALSWLVIEFIRTPAMDYDDLIARNYPAVTVPDFIERLDKDERWFSEIRIDTSRLWLSHRELHSLNLEKVAIRDPGYRNERANGRLKLNEMKIRHRFDLTTMTLKEIEVIDCAINKDARVRSAFKDFNVPAGIKITGCDWAGLDLEDLEMSSLEIADTTFSGDLRLKNVTVVGPTFDPAILNLSSIYVKGDLVLSNVTVHAIDLRDIRVSGRIDLADLTPESVGRILIDPDQATRLAHAAPDIPLSY